MKILVACEESQAVCKAFREKGHEAYSCDIQECSGGHPEWHIQDDVLPLLNGNCGFMTTDGVIHCIVGKWDMIIAFPPCTDLAVSGARHFEKKRADGRQKESIEFFCQFLNAECDKVVIENPVNIISGNYVQEHYPQLAEKYNLPIKPTQTIQPCEHGEPVRKKTCLWEKGVAPLKPTKIVEPELVSYIKKDGRKTTFSKSYCIGKDSHTSKHRSKTFEGVAKAMADQWG
jgi:site-specific DNA-cytosine methylase